MYLARLELHGFKSFAQRTVFTFNGGLTALVGPNGCGKSNVVDAIRWVLGEQRVRLLRAERMEQLIFNGSRTRKPLGMAEVSLTLLNRENRLPEAYTEIRITRRLYRDGTGEYLIGDTPCRLRDIQELFLDTGVGPNAYSIIELRMVEELLSERTEERRRLFEEAAGITRFRLRREATLRKLEATAADLTRLEDLILEVERQVRSLERQARRAQERERLEMRLRELEGLLLHYRLRECARALLPVRERLRELELEIASWNRERERLEAEKAGLEEALAASEAALEAARSAWIAQQTAYERHQLERIHLEERLQQTESRLQASHRETEELTRRIGDLEETLRMLEPEQEQACREHAERAHALQQAEQVRIREREALQAARQTRDRLRGEREKLAQMLRRMIETRAMEEARLKALEEKLPVLQAQLGERESALQILREHITRLEEALQAQRHPLKALQEERTRLQRELEGHLKELQATAHRMARVEAEMQLLGEALEASPDLQSVSGLFPSPPPTVLDLLEAEPGEEAALSAALGSLASAFVVETPQEALQAARILRQENGQKALFLVLEEIPPATPKHSLPEEAHMLARRIRARNAIGERVRDYVLGSVALCSGSLEELLEQARAHPELVWVNLQGDRLEGTALWRAGGPERSEVTDRLQKRRRQEELEREYMLLGRRRAEQEKTRRALSDRLEAVETELRTLLERIGEQEQELARLALERTRLEAEIGMLRTEMQTLEAQRSAQQKALSGQQGEETQTGDQLRAIEQQLAQAESRVRQQETSWARAEEAASKARLLETEARNRLEELTRQLLQTRRHLEESRRKRAELERQRNALEEERQGLRARLERLLAELDPLHRTLEEKHSQLEEREEEVRRQKNTLRTCLSSLQEIERRLLLLSQLRQELLLQQTRLEAEEAHLEARRAELGLEALPPAQPDLFDPEATHRELERLRKRLSEMGPTNALALQTYEEEKARLEFLIAQRRDIQRAMADLRSTLEETTRTALERFTETLQTVRTHFQELVRLLFEDVEEADLRLADPDDPLQSDILLYLRPRGKRPTSINQLSGGEKTLAAIALLFALYLVKPSPFCILDEVDAPLDEANTVRFLRLLAHFYGKTQFIVVTHNKRTMEAAETLYGITMEEPGVSRVVAVRLAEATPSP